MPATSFSIMKDTTGVSVAGGTALAFATDGQVITGGTHVVESAATDPRAAMQITMRVRQPKLQADGSWSKGKRTITLYDPFQRADGTWAPNFERYETDYDAETPAARRLENRRRLIQLCSDSELDAFHTSGSLT